MKAKLRSSESAKKGVATKLEIYGKDYFSKLGKVGGKRKVKKGFAMNIELARQSGRIGGKIGGLATKEDFKKNKEQK